MAQITANGTYGPYQWRGGGGTLVTSGNFGGANVQLQYSLDDGLTFTSYPGILQTAPGVSPFNISGAVVLQVDVSGGSGMNFFLQVNESDGATNIGTISVAGTGLASEATALASDTKLGTIDTDTGNIATDVAELKELSFGNNGITIAAAGDTTTSTTFRGIQVVADITTDATFVASGTVNFSPATKLDGGVVLKAGYHPIAGTASLAFAAGSGLAYIIHE